MKIKLVQSGGFLPVIKEAVAEVDWTNEETSHLLKEVRLKHPHVSKVRDGIYHTLEIGNKEVPVDLEKASGKFAKVLDMLKKDLKILKK